MADLLTTKFFRNGGSIALRIPAGWFDPEQDMTLVRDSWCISSLVFAELQFGLEKGKLKPRSRDSLQKFLGSAFCVTFDCAAAREGAMVRGELERLGRPASQMDYLIAGHARSLGSTLVTGNTRHLTNVGGLRVENWISPR